MLKKTFITFFNINLESKIRTHLNLVALVIFVVELLAFEDWKNINREICVLLFFELKLKQHRIEQKKRET